MKSFGYLQKACIQSIPRGRPSTRMATQVNRSGPYTAVNGLKTVTLRWPVIFRIRRSIYGLAPDELRTVLQTRLPSTIYGSVTNTVYGPFYTVLIKFLFDNSIHCSKYFFLLISILFIQIIHLFIYNDVDDSFNSGMPHVVFLLWKPGVIEGFI
jgi:hypothetical protein